VFNNIGFEYTYDMGRRTFSSIRHYFFVDKKWPMQSRQIDFFMALGFIWESAKKYSGAIAAGSDNNNFHFILRTNIEF